MYAPKKPDTLSEKAEEEARYRPKELLKPLQPPPPNRQQFVVDAEERPLQVGAKPLF